MKKFTIQAIVLILVIGIGIYFFNPATGGTKIDLPFLPQSPAYSTLEINGAKIKVEIAGTSAKRSKGLAGRTVLAENEGMLFVFDRVDKYPFWMKGLTFPLDFVWILDDKVAGVTENVQPPQSEQADSSLPIYSAPVPINKVLEVNAGIVKKLNIKEGDIIKLSPI